MKNAYVWIIWLITTILFLLSTRNPLYLMIVLVNLFILGNRLAKNQKGWIAVNLRFLASMILISAIVNGFFTHIGQITLFSLPENWLLIGGNITLESILYGVINGLIIGALYLTFNVLDLALSVKQMSQLIPRAFYPIAMTTTIALTFFPSIQQRAREIKEAQMIRGNPMKKIPDWLPILLPLLVTSLEDAILLSESMTSRGFHTYKKSKNEIFAVIGFILAIFLVFSGWILSLYHYPRIISLSLYVFGVLITMAILFFSTHGAAITRYREEIWNVKDILLSVLLLTAVILLFFLLITDRLNLSYAPYPTLSLPEVSFLGFIFAMIPLLPFFVAHND